MRANFSGLRTHRMVPTLQELAKIAYTTSPTESNRIGSVIDKINMQLNEWVRVGVIHPINMPNVFVYKDNVENKVMISAGDKKTLYMFNTGSYNFASEQEHHRYVKNLKDPQFVTLLDRKMTALQRQISLRQKSIDEMVFSINGYIDYAGSSDSFDGNDVWSYYDLDLRIWRNTHGVLSLYFMKNDIVLLQTYVSYIIHKLDQLYVYYGADIDVYSVWREFYADLRETLNYSTQINTLRNIFDEDVLRDRVYGKDTNKYYNTHESTQSQDGSQNTQTDAIDELQKMMNVLDVTYPYTSKRLTQKYRKLAVKHHPDKKGGDSKKFIEIKDAYDYLMKKLS